MNHFEYFELPQLKIDNESNIDAIDQLKDKFQKVDVAYAGHQVTYEEGIKEDKNDHEWVYYQDVDHGADFNGSPLIEKIVEDTCKVLNMPTSLIVRKQYTKMSPGWFLNIHRDVQRMVALLVEFKPAGGSISWYNNKREHTKTLYYNHPVVVNTGQLHSAKGGDTMTRYGFQLDFDYGMTINDVYEYYKSSPLFVQQ